METGTVSDSFISQGYKSKFSLIIWKEISQLKMTTALYNGFIAEGFPFRLYVKVEIHVYP